MQYLPQLSLEKDLRAIHAKQKCRVCGRRATTDIDWPAIGMVRAQSGGGGARAAVVAVQQGEAAHSRRREGREREREKRKG